MGATDVCGLAGFVEPCAELGREALEARVRAMADRVRHRGPDGEGAWCDPGVGLALGHRRLSIVDLSEAGAQPMHSASGRFVLAFNGELYDFATLRGELEAEGAKFRGHSDTEVLLAAIDAWGLDRALARANGMFAFALWDVRERRLTLVRDRLGKKPLYFGWVDGALVFGSELRVLRAHPAFTADIDREALGFFVQYSYVPAPHTIFRGIHKLAAGHRLDVVVGEGGARRSEPRAWWSLSEVVAHGAEDPFPGDVDEGIAALTGALDAAVARRRAADVPLGALLSSGLDSAAVVASLQHTGSEPVRTFTIGFEEAAYDESTPAAAIASHLGTTHETLVASADAARALIPSLPALYDEPFGDTSQIPTALVCRLARSRVTVALSGDGGDELWAGYDRYFRTLSRWRALARVPQPLRDAVAAALRSVAPRRSDQLAAALGSRGVRELFIAANARVPDPGRLVPGARPLASLFDTAAGDAPVAAPLAWMMWLDAALRLPESILVKVDRASMGVGLEVRSPLLDVELVRLCARFPEHWKRRDGVRKWLLRQAVARRVPAALLDRPKQGFGVPLASWLRGPLREWADDLLAPRSLAATGLLDPGEVRALWEEHQQGQRDRRFVLWNLLSFEAWRRDGDSHPARR